MILSALNIHHLRNISLTQLTPHHQVNLFYGPNGSGKTSLLEAIYLLCGGRSFRTREMAPLVQYEQDTLTVFAKTSSQESVSLQKNNNGVTRVRINQQPCLRGSDLARRFPCQLVYQDLFQIMDAGPASRRAMLDWGMFHVKHSYHEIWKEYKQVLKQRNALLRQKPTYQQILPWDKLFVELALDIEQLRIDYFQGLSELFQVYLEKLTNVSCTIDYYKGWDRRKTGKSLADILKEHFHLDCQRQFTHYGPHQADILFQSNETKAKTHLSRGQQKIVLIALKLAQAHMVKTPCLYLFDDISAELDTHHLKRLIDCLLDIQGQFFMTTIALESFMHTPLLEIAQIYHLNEGQCSLFQKAIS